MIFSYIIILSVGNLSPFCLNWTVLQYINYYFFFYFCKMWAVNQDVSQINISSKSPGYSINLDCLQMDSITLLGHTKLSPSIIKLGCSWMYCFLALISFFFKTSWENRFKSHTAVRLLFVPSDMAYRSKDNLALLNCGSPHKPQQNLPWSVVA